MNPLRWSRDHQVACVVVCSLGAVFGLFVGFFSVVATARSGFTAGALFKFWIQRPDLYWPWPTFGAVIAGLAFYAVRILRRPRPTVSASGAADALGAESRADDYYPVIARAISQLPSDTREARQTLYDRARMALAAQLKDGQHTSKSEAKRLALEIAIRRVEERASSSQSPHAIPVIPNVEHAPKKKFRQSVAISSPFHRPTTTLLIISIFFPRLWIIDFTCMSLYWVARLPKPLGLSEALRPQWLRGRSAP